MNRLINVLARIYPLKLIELFKLVNRYVLSAKIKYKFYKCGNNFKIHSPIYLRGEKNIVIGDDFWADPFLFLQCWDTYKCFKYNPQIMIGNHVHLGFGCHVGCINEIIIGDNLLTGRNVHITDHNHGHINLNEVDVAPIERELISKGKVIIGNNVWIGDNVVILPGAKIGDGCIIGANSVVSSDIPDMCVAAGVPAKPIRHLNPNN